MVLLVGLMCAFGASAQSALIATLMHGDEISTFQSSEALKQAYEKAVDGDVITLSSGTFNAPSEIRKAITIRGAGMMAYDGAKTTPTNITGNCTIRDNESDLELNIESVCFWGNISIQCSSLVNFTKTYFNRLITLNNTSNPIYVNVRMIHCVFYNKEDIAGISQGYLSSSSKVEFINSRVFIEKTRPSISDGSFSFDNCYIVVRSGLGFLYNHHLRNSIIWNNNVKLHSSSTANGCVSVGDANFFANCAPELNKSFPKDTPIFKEGTQTYELTDENQKNWIGTDGTQVGMHGGNLPFDPAVDAPVISKFNVASKTTADGKLSVDIEVKAAE